MNRELLGVEVAEGRVIEWDKPVRVYRNLAKGVKGEYSYSIQQKGLVVGYGHTFCLSDCGFFVGNGNIRAKETGQRNVHAFVIGYLDQEQNIDTPIRVSYDPFGDEWFYKVNTKERINASDWCRFTKTGVWSCEQ